MEITNAAPLRNAAILSVGAHRPERVVTNSELVERIDSSDEWIQQRTGIQTRHWAGPEESVVDMAASAAKIALDRAGLAITDIDSIILNIYKKKSSIHGNSKSILKLMDENNGNGKFIWIVS